MTDHPDTCPDCGHNLSDHMTTRHDLPKLNPRLLHPGEDDTQREVWVECHSCGWRTEAELERWE